MESVTISLKILLVRGWHMFGDSAVLTLAAAKTAVECNAVVNHKNFNRFSVTRTSILRFRY